PGSCSRAGSCSGGRRTMPRAASSPSCGCSWRQASPAPWDWSRESRLTRSCGSRPGSRSRPPPASGVSSAAFDRWPAGGRRGPPRTGPTYHLLAALSQWIQAQARESRQAYGPYRLLDVGCGAKPYYPFFAEYVSEYVGVDPVHPDAELKGTV